MWVFKIDWSTGGAVCGSERISMNKKGLMGIVWAIAVGCALLLSGCAAPPDSSNAYPGESAEQVFQRGEVALRAENYTEAIARFEALDTQYPFVTHSRLAKLHTIYAHYRNSDNPSAIASATRYLRLYPASPNADYAYYLRGLAHYHENIGIFERLFSVDFAKRDLTPLRDAFADFTHVYQHYPNGAYATPAYRYAVYLRDLLAKHALQVATFYFDRTAYVAAINRAQNVMQHYPGTPAVLDALRLMIKSYDALHLPCLAEKARRILAYNTAHSNSH